jgi:hypothetical protein
VSGPGEVFLVHQEPADCWEVGYLRSQAGEVAAAQEGAACEHGGESGSKKRGRGRWRAPLSPREVASSPSLLKDPNSAAPRPPVQQPPVDHSLHHQLTCTNLPASAPSDQALPVGVGSHPHHRVAESLPGHLQPPQGGRHQRGWALEWTRFFGISSEAGRNRTVWLQWAGPLQPSIWLVVTAEQAVLLF